MKRIHTSIVIPTYNEAGTIAHTITAVRQYFRGLGKPFEIIVVDDKSTDETLTILRELELTARELRVIVLPKNSWKGWAVRTGVLSARGDYILITDADLSTPISEYATLEHVMIEQKADVVIGSRFSHAGHDQRETQPTLRRLFGKMFTYLRKSLVTNVSDTQCGFKLFAKKAADDLFSRQRLHNIVFDVEILYLATKLNYKIKEMPIKWQHRVSTRMQPSIVNCAKTLSSLYFVWRLHHTLNQKKPVYSPSFKVPLRNPIGL